MSTDLFRGRLVRLACQDVATDAETLARWSRDSEFLRLRSSNPARPRTAKYYQDEEARHPASGNRFAFNILALEGDRLVGFTSLWVANWANAEGWVGIFIGERADWGRGYGTDAMRVLLGYAFAELNLARVSLATFATNARAIRSYQKAGFIREGTQREAVLRDGRRSDDAVMGILRDEYLRGQTPADQCT
jgi:RimJ/RimL family protein N-acetyltransferase